MRLLRPPTVARPLGEAPSMNDVADAVRSFVAADVLRAYATVLEIDGGSFKKKGVELYTRCCFHDDEHPSFRINLTKGVWRCDVCGCGGDIFDLYGRRENLGRGDFPQKVSGLAKLLGINGQAVARRDGSPGRSRIIATYDYRDEKDELVYQVVRYEPKDFRQRRPDGKSGWIWNLEGVRRVPYRLPELLRTPLDEWVLVVEGEKDADRLASLGLMATTNCGGAGKWRAEYNEHFHGRRVAVVPDNDEPGRKHAEQVARELCGVAAEVRVVALPGLALKGDVSDWLDTDGTRERLLELVEKADRLNDLRIEFRKAQQRASAQQKHTGTSIGPQPITSADDLLRELARISPSMPPADLSAGLQALALRISPLTALDYAVWREVVVKRFSELGFGGPAKLADALLPRASMQGERDAQGADIDLENLEPWSGNGDVTASELLDELESLFRRFLVLPEHGSAVLASWSLLTYVFDSFDVCPLLTIVSPVRRCGKTGVLELLSTVAYRPLVSSNVTASAIFRAIDRWHPTVIVDEFDTLEGNEEIRGVLNSGHTRRLAFVIRNVGDDHEPKKFSTWGPKVLALIGRPPDTIEDRSIMLRMRRRAKNEPIERVRLERFFVECRELREKCLRWAKETQTALRMVEPKLPAELNDRAADNFRPLIAIADLAGGDWPALIRKAAKALAAAVLDSETAGVLLLNDVRTLFAELGDKVPSETLCKRLGEMEEKPWPEWTRSGKPISPRGVARLFEPFGIKPKTIRLRDQSTPKGYDLADFEEAFERYLTPDTHADPEKETPYPPHRHKSHGSRAGDDFPSATPAPDVADGKLRKPASEATCGGVADGEGDIRRERELWDL